MTGDPPAGPRLLGALRSADGKGVVRRSRLAHGLGRPDELVIEATLTADGEQTILVVEEWGTPPEPDRRLRGGNPGPCRRPHGPHRRA
jgi:hypothetical protein